MAIRARLAKAWNVFIRNEENPPDRFTYSPSFAGSSPPHVPRRMYSTERSIISSIYNRICMDVAGIEIKHVKVDENGYYLDDIDSSINRLMGFEPNIDQGPRAFRQDIVMTMFDHGAAAIVPVDTLVTPTTEQVAEYLNFRVGQITEWLPQHVRVNLYNEIKGCREEVLLPKRTIGIAENPLYSIINEPNSTLQRLKTKLHLLDEIDEATSSKRIDVIIQLPYVIKSEAMKARAEQRRQDIEFQLKESQYGIAYTDGTEKITQLNRPAENNLLKQIEFLQETLYDQLGITKEVLNGTADEKTMNNYTERTIEPIVDSITEAMQRSFLGLTGRNRSERIKYFKNPFSLAPLQEVATAVDKFSRNEILAPNEVRSFMGIKPSKDPKANELHNSNMPTPIDQENLEE